MLAEGAVIKTILPPARGQLFLQLRKPQLVELVLQDLIPWVKLLLVVLYRSSIEEPSVACGGIGVPLF